MIKKFETQEELHRYLLRNDRPKVRYVHKHGELGKAIVGYNNGRIWSFDQSRPVPNISLDPQRWTPYEGSDWYDKPEAKGVLCFFQDKEDDRRGYLAFFDHYSVDNVFPFVDHTDTGWRYARPATLEELSSFYNKALALEKRG